MTMDLTPLPLSIRAMNHVGRGMFAVGLKPINLSSKALIEQAKKETGLSDFGSDTFREPMELLLQSLESEAQLSLMGRMVARGDLVRLLKTRLQIVDTLKQHPEIEQQKVERPLVVIGPPRTGTTVFHDLLAEDADNRVPLSWEVNIPCPPPEAATYKTDPRIAEVQAQLDQVDSMVPDFKKMHPMGAERAQECVAFTAMEFTSMIFDVQFRVPSYEQWANDADVSAMFGFHRQFLQLLQWKHPGKRWALKSPQHLWHMRALMEAYPDACIVQTHRDPVRVLVSISSLIATIRRLSTDHIDLNDIAQHYAGWLANAFQHTISVRESGLLPPEQIVDIQFSEFVQGQVACVRRAYDHFGMELTESAASKMQGFIDDNPADKHGKHAYRFQDTGLDLGETRALFKPYQDYFNIPSEQV